MLLKQSTIGLSQFVNSCPSQSVKQTLARQSVITKSFNELIIHRVVYCSQLVCKSFSQPSQQDSWFIYQLFSQSITLTVSKSVSQPISQSVSKSSAIQSNSQSLSQSVINHSISQSVCQSISQSMIVHSVSQSFNQLVRQYINQTVSLSVTQ